MSSDTPEGFTTAASPSAASLSPNALAALKALPVSAKPTFYGFNVRPRQVRHYACEKAAESVAKSLALAAADPRGPTARPVVIGYASGTGFTWAEARTVAALYAARLEAKAADALARREAANAEDLALSRRSCSAGDAVTRKALEALRKRSHRAWAKADELHDIYAAAAARVRKALLLTPAA